MLTYRDLPASAQALRQLTTIASAYAAAHALSPREVQALLDAVRQRVCAELARRGDVSGGGRTAAGLEEDPHG